MLFPILSSGLAQAYTYTPIDDSGDSGYLDTGDDDDTGDSGDGGVVIPAPDNDYDGHLDGKLAYQLAGDEGGCATVGGPADLVLALVLVGGVAGRLRRPRR